MLSDMESDEAAMDTAAAAAQLAALDANRAGLAERAVQPWWYDVLLGLLGFGFLASYATHDWWLIGGAALVFLAGLYGLAAVYRRRTGMWVSGQRPGRTQRALAVWFWCCVAWVVVALLDAFFGLTHLLVGASALCGVALGLVSRWWTRLYVAELRVEP